MSHSSPVHGVKHYGSPQGALLVVEQGEREAPVAAEGYEDIDRRTYGAAQIGFYRFAG